MRRSSDRPSTVPEALRSTNGGIEELARRQGRGTQALRNDAGHVITLDPAASNPVLRPQNAGGDYVTGMQFDQYGVRVVNPIYGTGNGDLTANAIATQSYVSAGGAIVANGGVTSNNGATINGQINLDGNLAMGFNQIFAGDIHVQNAQMGNITGVNGNYSANQAAPRFIATIGLFGPVNPSERRLKTHTGDLVDPLDTVRKLRPAAWRWNDLEQFGLPEESAETLLGGEHVGIYVDELADIDPRAVRTGPNGHVGYEDRALMAYLVGAVQQLADRNDALTTEIGQLRTELESLSDGEPL